MRTSTGRPRSGDSTRTLTSRALSGVTATTCRPDPSANVGPVAAVARTVGRSATRDATRTVTSVDERRIITDQIASTRQFGTNATASDARSAPAGEASEKVDGRCRTACEGADLIGGVALGEDVGGLLGG